MFPSKLSALLLLVVFVATLAAAGPQVSLAANLIATDILAEGNVTVDAVLLLLTRYGDDLVVDNSALQFTLDASDIRVVTQESSSALEVGPAWFAPTTPGPPSNGESYSNVLVQGSTGKFEYQFDVYPTGAGSALISLTSTCASLTASNRETVPASWRVAAPSSPIESNVGQATQWVECGQSVASITGDFVVVLWQINATLESNGSSVALPSGYDRAALPEPASSTAYPAVSHVRQQYLYVTNGTLTIPQMDASPHWAYLDNPAVETDGALVIAGAQGELHQGSSRVPIDASVLSLEGTLDFTATKESNHALRLDLGGQLRNAEADGQPLSFTSTPAPEWMPRWGLYGLVGAVLAAPILVVPRMLHRRREERLAADEIEDIVDRVEHMVAGRRYAEALPASLQLVGLAPRHARAQFLRAKVLRCTGYTREALEHHQRARDLGLLAGLDPAWVAAMDFNAARAAMDLADLVPRHGRSPWEAKALQYLNEAAAADGAILAELDLHPGLDDLYWAQVSHVGDYETLADADS